MRGIKKCSAIIYRHRNTAIPVQRGNIVTSSAVDKFLQIERIARKTNRSSYVKTVSVLASLSRNRKQKFLSGWAFSALSFITFPFPFSSVSPFPSPSNPPTESVEHCKLPMHNGIRADLRRQTQFMYLEHKERIYGGYIIYAILFLFNTFEN